MTAKEENGFKISPKDKALDLFVKFYERYPASSYSNEAATIEAKHCALVAVDEIMSELIGYDFYYWQEVRKEIEKL